MTATRGSGSTACGELDSPIGFEVRDSTFVGNTGRAGSNSPVLVGGIATGGAVSIKADVQMSGIHFYNCTFKTNALIAYNGAELGGVADGGAVSISLFGPSVPDIVIDESEFFQSTTTIMGAAPVLGGTANGALSIHGSFTLDLNRTRFVKNKADSSEGVATGGAVSLRWENRREDFYFSINLNACQFVENTARGAAAYGGALYIDHKLSSMGVKDTIFANNTVDSLKCSLLFFSLPPDLTWMLTDAGSGGGAAIILHSDDQRLVWSTTTVVGNQVIVPESSSSAGAGVYLKLHSGASSASFTACSFCNNTFLLQDPSESGFQIAGGGLYYEGAYETFEPVPKFAHTLALINSNFVNNGFFGKGYRPSAALGMGLALLHSSGSNSVLATLTTTTFAGNQIEASAADEAGGAAVYAGTNTSLCLEYCTFENNRVSVTNEDNVPKGTVNGALYSLGTVNMSLCQFLLNSAAGRFAKGGALAGVSVFVSDSLFVQNSASGDASGGAIFLSEHQKSPVVAQIRTSHFAHNNVSAVLRGADLTGENDPANPHRGGGAIAMLNPQCALFHAVFFSYFLIRISFLSFLAYEISNCSFDANQAEFGGAIFVETGGANVGVPEPPPSAHNEFVANRANTGGAVYLGYDQNTPAYNLLCMTQLCTEGKYKLNTATWGSVCSSFPRSLVADGLPSVLWPGLEFDMKIRVLDVYNCTVSYAMRAVDVVISNSISAEARLQGTRDLQTGAYQFRGLRSDVNASTETFVFTARLGEQNDFSLTHRVVVPVAKCPPGFQERYFRGGLAGCESCGVDTYSLAGHEECVSCLGDSDHGAGHEGGGGHEQEKDGSDRHQVQSCLSPPHDRGHAANPGLWTVKAGFYPEPSPLRPSVLRPCLNHQACTEIKCILMTANVSAGDSLHLDCGGNCSATDSHLSCLCNEGYTDRLCSRCVCDSPDACFFSLGGEEHLCKACTPLSSGVLIGVAAFLLVSQVLFLLFKKSAVAILLAEFVVTAVLLFLGLAEWYLFDMVVATGLLFLINSTSADSGSHFALPTSAVKILIFFVPTTMTVVPASLWPQFARALMAKINNFTLRMSGLECIAPDLFARASGRLVFVLLVPLLFAAVVLAGHLIAALLSKFAFIRRMQRCSCLRKKKKNAGRDHTSDGDESESSTETDSSYSSSRSLLGESRAPPNSDASEDESNRSHNVLDEDDVHINSASEDNRPLLENGNHAIKLPSHTSKASLWAQISFSLQFILFASQVELSNVVLETLRTCKDGYMVSYPWVPCSSISEEHRTLITIALFFLFVYVIGVPVLFVGQLLYYRRRIALHDHVVEHRIGFLYETYRPEVFWFEAAWLGRRTLISVCVSLIASGLFSTGAVLVVLLASLFVQRHVMPFSSQSANYLELISTACLLLSFAMGKVLPAPGEAGTEVVVMQILLWLLNIFVVLALLAAVLAPALHQAGRRLKMLCRKRRRAPFDFSGR